MKSYTYILLFLNITTLGYSHAIAGVKKLEEVFSWKQITYNFVELSEHNKSLVYPENSSQIKPIEHDLNDSSFIQYNNLPFGVDRWKDKVFITVPRRRPGIPSTLNYVSLTHDKYNKSPGLRPYPDIKTNSLTSEKPLVNVYRTRVDICDRIWMVDTGITETQGTMKPIQHPAIVIFNLLTDELISRYELREEDYKCTDHSGFISITVDVDKDDCDNAFAYLPDLSNNALVVYSLRKNTSWKVNHNFFYLEPEFGDMNIGGIPFQWNDGIFSVALGPVNYDGFRDAYFHAMASNKVRVVSTEVLRNETLSTRRFHGNDFKSLGGKGANGQCTTHGVHQESGIMVFAQIAKNALTCWNTHKQLSEKTLGVIAQDNEKFIYPSDMKVENNNIWVITNRLPLYLYSKLDTDDTNFRVFRTTIQNAVADTVCV